MLSDNITPKPDDVSIAQGFPDTVNRIKGEVQHSTEQPW
jgi:hypothetical protein